MTFELIERKTPSEGREAIPKQRYTVVFSQKVMIKPQHQDFLQTKVHFRKNLKEHTA